ncbi:MAG: superoxide dismutase, Ni [Candidatus Micrarchaeales archaeon]|nr:superoxide dismutase, Ni [Candidatus Micrarchaeales archaeon]
MAMRSIARSILSAVDKVVHFREVHAHCDIPCGIYDPHQAQVAAHTVLRMDMLIADLMKSNPTSADDRNKLVRYIAVKEQHAELVKHEVRVIWGDYAKPENADAKTHELVWSIMKAASKAKQDANIESAKDLLSKVEQFAEWFWKTKKVGTVRAKAPGFPTEAEMVFPKV